MTLLFFYCCGLLVAKTPKTTDKKGAKRSKTKETTSGFLAPLDTLQWRNFSKVELTPYLNKWRTLD